MLRLGGARVGEQSTRTDAQRKDTYVLTVKYTKSSVGSGDGDDADMTAGRICRRLKSGKCGGYK